MNRYRTVIAPLLLILVLAACGAPDAPEPETAGDPTPTATPAATATATASAPTEAPASSAAATPRATERDAPMSPDDEPKATVEVSIVNFAFSPAEVTVTAGTELIFTNLDAAPHTVTAGSDADPMPELFDSGLLRTGESFSLVLEEPGTFAFFCDRHPPMEGVIVVEQ